MYTYLRFFPLTSFSSICATFSSRLYRSISFRSIAVLAGESGVRDGEVRGLDEERGREKELAAPADCNEQVCNREREWVGTRTQELPPKGFEFQSSDTTSHAHCVTQRIANCEVRFAWPRPGRSIAGKLA